MAKKKKELEDKSNQMVNAYIEGAGLVANEKITETLEKNYMPYAMSVIVSRAFPEIDGFKPSHRKLLYTMYKMGLLNGTKTKSANVVGQTMRLNPHGDQAIYETMVRLARGNEALLHPYVDSKGNFGKAYSRDMAYAASRYTEVKLDPLCNELFSDIDKDTVDFIPNYDNTTTEPTLLPASFPSILVNSNVGIGVSMASAVCPFNLSELCDTTIALMKNQNHDIISTLKAPDFPGGGYIVYDEEELKTIYETGRGSIKVRSKYNFDKSSNCLEITQIPPTTTVEAIIEKIIALIKQGKIKEVSYIRDETDKNGLKIAIDLKRGTDPEKLIIKLFKMTPLQDNFSCNFNILIHGYPKVMGVYDILNEWILFRTDCIKRRITFDLSKKKEKLHLLLGLAKILLDIDKAVSIVRNTEEEADVVPNLMIGFSIDEIQAEYVAEIKLRHLNREYILKRTSETDDLQREIIEMTDILNDEKKLRKVIIKELGEVSKKYGRPRKSMLIYQDEISDVQVDEEALDYPVNIFISKEGYFKKITPASLRMSSEQKLKDGDEIIFTEQTTNKAEILFFTNKCQVYKTKASAFDDTKASVMGDYIPAKLSFDDGERVDLTVITNDYQGYIIYIFDNGKVAKVPLDAYETKTNRKKLSKAYSDKAKIVDMFYIEEHANIMMRSTNGRMIIFNTALLIPKSTRDTIGVQVMTLKSNSDVEKAFVVNDSTLLDLSKYIIKAIPAAGPFAKDIEDPDQITF